MIAKGSEGFAYEVFVQERAVNLGGVKECDAAFHGYPGRSSPACLAVREAHAHAAEPDGGDFQIAVSKFALLHFDVVVVRLNHSGETVTSDSMRGLSLGIVRSLSRSCGKRTDLQGAAELRRPHANNAPEHLREMARTRVANLQRNFDEAAGRFADQSLCAGDPLSGNELQRRHPCCLLEHTGKVEGAEFHQIGQRLDGNVPSEMLAT